MKGTYGETSSPSSLEISVTLKEFRCDGHLWSRSRSRVQKIKSLEGAYCVTVDVDPTPLVLRDVPSLFNVTSNFLPPLRVPVCFRLRYRSFTVPALECRSHPRVEGLHLDSLHNDFLSVLTDPFTSSRGGRYERTGKRSSGSSERRVVEGHGGLNKTKESDLV